MSLPNCSLTRCSSWWQYLWTDRIILPPYVLFTECPFRIYRSTYDLEYKVSEKTYAKNEIEGRCLQEIISYCKHTWNLCKPSNSWTLSARLPGERHRVQHKGNWKLISRNFLKFLFCPLPFYQWKSSIHFHQNKLRKQIFPGLHHILSYKSLPKPE